MTNYKTSYQIAQIVEETHKQLAKKYNKKVNKEEVLKSIKFYKHSMAKGQIKFRNYFKEIIRTEQFKNEVAKIRAKFKIPKNGFNEEDCQKSGPYQDEYLKSKKIEKNYYKDVKRLADSFGFFSHYWAKVFDEFIWYNTNETLYSFFMYLDTCFLEGIYGFETLLSSETYYNPSKNNKASINKMYPVVLRISPYASIKDIIDYINKFSAEIKAEQDKYKDKNHSKISKVRYKENKKQLRNDFIYENKHFSIKKIRRLVSEKFGEHLDDGHIGKILSIERERRN